MTQDSLYFAEFWSRVEVGDTVSAREYLLDLGKREGDSVERLANFMLAVLASEEKDYDNVPVFLSLGVPSELKDHAEWLRANALEAAGQGSLAEDYRKILASDTESVYREDAIFKLAHAVAEDGYIDSLLSLISIHNRISATTQDRQKLDLLATELLSGLGSHEYAVNRLWSTYLADPSTEEGREARKRLDAYSSTYGYEPRPVSFPEFEEELKRLLDTGEAAVGLNRLEREWNHSQWIDREDLMLYYRGRFAAAQRRYRDSVRDFEDLLEQHPSSRFYGPAQYYLGRAAYLFDQDSLAVMILENVVNEYPVDAGRALELLGILHQDRGRAGEAALTFRRWLDRSRGTREESDALWRLGWALWEIEEFRQAAKRWEELTALGWASGYHPAALYWAYRACQKAGELQKSTGLCRTLKQCYPYSYYSVILSEDGDTVAVRNEDLEVTGLDELWTRGGVHTRKLALLTAMRLPELALMEWNAAVAETPELGTFPWWKVRLLLWNGERLSAWRTARSALSRLIITGGLRPPEFFPVVYPLDYDLIIKDLCSQYGLDPFFIYGLICQESHFEEDIVSRAGAVGLMQLMPGTARRQAKKLGTAFSESDLYNPEYNLRIGIAHAAELMEEFQGDTVLVLAAYNAGRSAAQAWFEELGGVDSDVFVEKIPYRETRLFVKKVIEHASAYRRLYTYPEQGASAETQD